MKLPAKTIEALKSVEKQQRELARHVGKPVWFERTGKRAGIILSVALGHAEVRRDSGAVDWFHVITLTLMGR